MSLTRNLKQDITIWSRSANDGYGGASYGAPATSKCRWEDKVEMVRDENGDEVYSKAMLFLKLDVAVGDYVYLGTSVEADPTAVQGAEQVKAFRKLPTVRANEFERKAWV